MACGSGGGGGRLTLPHLLSIALCLQGCHLRLGLPVRSLCCAGRLLQRSALLLRSCQLPLQAAIYAIENALLPPAERCMVHLWCRMCQLRVFKAHRFAAMYCRPLRDKIWGHMQACCSMNV